MKLKPQQKELIKTYATTPTTNCMLTRIGCLCLTLFLFYFVTNIEEYAEGNKIAITNMLYCYIIVCIGICLWRIGCSCLNISLTCDDKNFVFNEENPTELKGKPHELLMKNFVDFSAIKTRVCFTLDWMQFSFVFCIAITQTWIITANIFATLFLLTKVIESIPGLISRHYVQKLTPDMIMVKTNTEIHPYFEIKEELPTDFDWEPQIVTPDTKKESTQENPFKRYKRSVQFSE